MVCWSAELNLEEEIVEKKKQWRKKVGMMRENRGDDET
jgi:hypothetical protein